MPDALTFPLRSAFLALPLEQDAKWQFQALQESLQPFEEILNLQNPETPHLTLQFWPSLMQIEFSQVINQAEKIAASTRAFRLATTDVQTFGKPGSERVLFLSVAFSDELARVKKACPWPNIQPFAPHITLARIRHPQKFTVQKKKILKALEPTTFEMSFDRLRLYAEVDGKAQTPLQDFPFAGS